MAQAQGCAAMSTNAPRVICRPISGKFNAHQWRYLLASKVCSLIPTYRWILTVASYHADTDGTKIWPSTNTLSERTSCSPATVKRAIRAGAEHGWIQRRCEFNPQNRQRRRELTLSLPGIVWKNTKPWKSTRPITILNPKEEDFSLG